MPVQTAIVWLENKLSKGFGCSLCGDSPAMSIFEQPFETDSMCLADPRPDDAKRGTVIEATQAQPPKSRFSDLSNCKLVSSPQSGACGLRGGLSRHSAQLAKHGCRECHVLADGGQLNSKCLPVKL